MIGMTFDRFGTARIALGHKRTLRPLLSALLRGGSKAPQVEPQLLKQERRVLAEATAIEA